MGFRQDRRTFRATVLAGSAMCCAGIIAPKDAISESSEGPQTTEGPQGLQEITVTATRRATGILEIPYNISAVTAEGLAQRGITDITDLDQIMPGLDYPNQGAGRDAYSTPIIRGLNLTPTNQNFYPLGSVSPVSTYIGDSPISGRFPLNDLQRVEVLRGPQGTLYGAGAIGGTIRLIPNDPEIGKFDGHLDASTSSLDHSNQPNYSLDGVVNIPINERMAFRLSARYEADAGFIDDVNAVKRSGGQFTASAILADPGDPATSASVRNEARDVNWSENYGGRAALLIQATDSFRLNLSFDYSRVAGGDNPAVSTSFGGGPDVVDPRITVPSPGPYQQVDYIGQPYARDSQLPALDASWDLGFATLSSNTAYFDTHGLTVTDQTYDATGFPAGVAQYYLGIPTFPRYILPLVVGSDEKDESEELRLVSNTKGSIDYVVGAFFRHTQQSYTTTLYAPGASAWDAASPAPSLPIVVFPNSNDAFYKQTISRDAIDRALYGELTYHVSPTVQVTGGGRFYWQFNSSNNYIADSLFGGYTSASENTFVDHGALGKLNASWNYLTDHRLYATFSQGYRPGGANGIPLSGALAELPNLLTYRPDKANNYEVGAKGVFNTAINYTIDVYYMDLKDAQISTVTPVGWPVVVNSNGAKTRGVELEVNGRLIDHLSYTAGYSYSDAFVSRDFNIPTHFGQLGGMAGEQLPGSPRNSWAASLTYDYPLPGAYDLLTTPSVSHKGAMETSLPELGDNVALPGYTLTNVGITLQHDQWRASLYSNNVTNARAFTSATSPSYISGRQGALGYIEPPREVGLRIRYSF